MADNEPTPIYALCKFCGTSAQVKTSGGELMFKPGEKFLGAHSDPHGRPCVNGSGLGLRDNQQPLVNQRLWRGNA